MTPIEKYLDNEEYPFEGSMGQRAFAYLRDHVETCMKNGEIKEDNIDEVSQALWAGAHGATALLIAHCNFPFVSQDRLIDKTLELLLDGLKV